MPRMKWVLSNLLIIGVLVIVAFYGSALLNVVLALSPEPVSVQLENATFFLLTAGSTAIPAAILYLLLVGALPERLSLAARRAMSVVLAPVSVLPIYVLALGPLDDPPSVLRFLVIGVALPVAIGMLITLRHPPTNEAPRP